MFALYDVIRQARRPDRQDEIQKFIHSLSNSQEKIPVHTLGAKSQHGSGDKRSVGSLVRFGSTSPFGRRLLSGLSVHFNCRTIYELGTSLGLTTLYLSRDPHTSVFTFEGNEALVEKARTHFQVFDRKNIRIIEGDINKTLGQALAEYPPPNLAYIDANHRYEPTLRYVRMLLKHGGENVILVIGDIHWSAEMTTTWESLKCLDEVTVSVDLFEAGLLFFRSDLTPGHYIL